MIRVMLADDQAMVRGALGALLSLEKDIEVVAEVGDGRAVLKEAPRCLPDVVVMDVDMPELDGLEATACLRKSLPQVKILIVTTYGCCAVVSSNTVVSIE